MNKKYNIYGFTLIEITIGVLIFSFVVIAGFQALSAIGIGKIKLMNKVNLEKQNNYFSLKLFEEIKKGGKIDYEEYFNRKVVGTNFSSGHYEDETGFGNFGYNGIIGSVTYGNNFYYCISGDGDKLNSSNGCYNDSSKNSIGVDTTNNGQRYGQYALQFIDYNSNYDDDLGDEDSDGNILGDYDDEYLGEGPIVFNGGTDVKELYLISGNKQKRTIFRWNVSDDPDAPTTTTCDYSNAKSPTGSGCLGTIEFLKLEGRDWGFDHTISTGDVGEFDGNIDTWIVEKDFLGLASDVVIGSDSEDYWVSLFPDTINVSDFQVFAYPNKDLDLSWRDSLGDINIAPYVRIKFSLLPSWKERKKIRGNIVPTNFSTTIALTDIFSK